MLLLYGISNCDTVKKARAWLDQHGLDYAFIDIRKNPLQSGVLSQWGYTCGWDVLVNKRSRTWRELDEADKTNLSAQSAIKLLQTHPTLMKRPVLEINKNNVLVGFNEKDYCQHLQS